MPFGGVFYDQEISEQHIQRADKIVRTLRDEEGVEEGIAQLLVSCCLPLATAGGALVFPRI